jgi:hypothetical protein
VKHYSRILGIIQAQPGYRVVEIHMDHDIKKAWLSYRDVIAWVTVRYDKDKYEDRIDCVEAAYLDEGELRVTSSMFNSDRLIAGPNDEPFIEERSGGGGAIIDFRHKRHGSENVVSP